MKFNKGHVRVKNSRDFNFDRYNDKKNSNRFDRYDRKKYVSKNKNYVKT